MGLVGLVGVGFGGEGFGEFEGVAEGEGEGFAGAGVEFEGEFGGGGGFDGGFVLGFEGVDVDDFAGFVEVDEVEGDEGVFHPEAVVVGFFEDEEHAAVFGEGGTIHETELAFGVGVGDFDGEGLVFDGEVDGGEGECGLRGGVTGLGLIVILII